jgi:hypothetical protein
MNSVQIGLPWVQRLGTMSAGGTCQETRAELFGEKQKVPLSSTFCLRIIALPVGEVRRVRHTSNSDRAAGAGIPQREDDPRNYNS